MGLKFTVSMLAFAEIRVCRISQSHPLPLSSCSVPALGILFPTASSAALSSGEYSRAHFNTWMGAHLLHTYTPLFQSFVKYKMPRTMMSQIKEDTRNCYLHPAHPPVTWAPQIPGSTVINEGVSYSGMSWVPSQCEGSCGVCLLSWLSEVQEEEGLPSEFLLTPCLCPRSANG